MSNIEKPDDDWSEAQTDAEQWQAIIPIQCWLREEQCAEKQRQCPQGCSEECPQDREEQRDEECAEVWPKHRQGQSKQGAAQKENSALQDWQHRLWQGLPEVGQEEAISSEAITDLRPSEVASQDDFASFCYQSDQPEALRSEKQKDAKTSREEPIQEPSAMQNGDKQQELNDCALMQSERGH